MSHYYVDRCAGRYVGRVILGAMMLGAMGCGGSQPQAASGEGTAAPSSAPPAPAEGAPQTPGASGQGASAAKLECAMSVAPTVKAGAPVELQFRLSNRGAGPVYVLTWQTPLEGRPLGAYLQVTRDGAEVSYQGPMAKRADPSASSYVTIAPGASVDGKVDVALSYDMKKPGRYHIAFRNTLVDVATNASEVPHTLNQLHTAEVACAPVETVITAP